MPSFRPDSGLRKTALPPHLEENNNGLYKNCSSIDQSQMSNHILGDIEFNNPKDEFKFVNNDDSIQRDMSFHNSSKGSILHSSDVDTSEDQD